MGSTNVARCAGCARTILWQVTPAGKRMPLDPELLRVIEAPPGEAIALPAGTVVRMVVAEEDGRVFRARDVRPQDEAQEGVRVLRARVSHWATCPKAATFRDGKSRAP